MDTHKLAYIAGLFDGEGSARISMVKNKNGKHYKKIEARVTQCDREVLDWIIEEFGFGKVYIKSDKRGDLLGWKTCHDLVFAYRMARTFLTAIEPYLKIKKQHITSLLDLEGRLPQA
jgi:hypothetical protein